MSISCESFEKIFVIIVARYCHHAIIVNTIIFLKVTFSEKIYNMVPTRSQIFFCFFLLLPFIVDLICYSKLILTRAFVILYLYHWWSYRKDTFSFKLYNQFSIIKLQSFNRSPRNKRPQIPQKCPQYIHVAKLLLQQSWIPRNCLQPRCTLHDELCRNYTCCFVQQEFLSYPVLHRQLEWMASTLALTCQCALWYWATRGIIMLFILQCMVVI